LAHANHDPFHFLSKRKTKNIAGGEQDLRV
jgi:hypothetical protein